LNSILILVVLISSVAYILGGMIILIKINWSQTSVLALTAMSAGLLLAIALLDLIPDTQNEIKNSSFYILVGFIIMYLISFTANFWKKDKGDQIGFEGSSMIGISVGMSLHNFFEGLSLGVSYAISVKLGIVVSIALILHKIPEGISYSSSVLALSRNRKKTVIYLFIQGLCMWVGTGLSILLAHFTEISEKFIAIPIAITAGIFLYLGGTALLPVTNKIPDKKIPIAFLSGIIFYFIFHGISEYLG
jgi:zinc transporter ZupT